MKLRARWNSRVVAVTVSSIVVAVSAALAEPATVPSPVAAPATVVAAPTAVAGDSSAAVRAMVEQRLAPHVGELEDRLEQLRKQVPTAGKSPERVKERIQQLQQQVGAIRAEIDATSARLVELRISRPERRAQSLRRLEEVWGTSTLQRPEVAAELSTHARRVARLERAKDVAQQSHDDASKERAAKLLAAENRRHEAVMADLVPAKGGPSASTPSHP